MKIRALLATIGILWGLFLAPVSQSQPAESPEKIFKFYGLSAFPGLTFLCRQRVYPSPSSTPPLGKHITWEGFASPSPPSALLDFYKKSLGVTGRSTEGSASTWRLPANPPYSERSISIHPSASAPLISGCGVKNPYPSGSVVILSTYD